MSTGRSNDAVTADDILNHVGAHATVHALHNAHEPLWDAEPAPLRAERLLPAFPVDALPGWLADHVAAVAEATQTPTDLPGCLAMACLAAAAGGKVVVQARPGWPEPTNLYVVVAMPPGSRKSAVLAAMTAPIIAVEKALVDASKPLIADARVASRIAQDHAEKVARAAVNSGTEEARLTAQAEATQAAIDADSISIPVEPQLIADDVTPEAAASLLARQGGRLAILSDEGGIFGTLAGRYNGSGQPNLDVFLKGHSGAAPLRVHRVGREAEYIDHPALTLGLTVQPSVLRDIARISGARDRGLLARILYALPVNTVGHRQVGAAPVPADVAQAYDSRVRALTTTFNELADPVNIPLSHDADTRLLRFERELEPQLAEDGPLAHITDWASKLAGAIVRTSGLLHLAAHLHDGWARPIDAVTFDQAARLGRYWLGHALAVFDHMGADPTIADARCIIDWIARIGAREFTRRDLFTGVSRARFTKATDLDPGLALLEEHGYIRRADPPVTGRGRRSITYAVHPNVINTHRPSTESS